MNFHFWNIFFILDFYAAMTGAEPLFVTGNRAKCICFILTIRDQCLHQILWLKCFALFYIEENKEVCAYIWIRETLEGWWEPGECFWSPNQSFFKPGENWRFQARVYIFISYMYCKLWSLVICREQSAYIKHF